MSQNWRVGFDRSRGPVRRVLAVTFIVVLAPALIATGAASATLGRAPRVPAIVRNVLGGALAMGVTYGIGSLAGAAGIGARACTRRGLLSVGLAG